MLPIDTNLTKLGICSEPAGSRLGLWFPVAMTWAMPLKLIEFSRIKLASTVPPEIKSFSVSVCHCPFSGKSPM